MNKPIKPNITIPESFAKNGIKTDFDSDLIASGFDDLKPDVLAGDNLNKFIDDTYQGLNYGMAAADAINLINEGETLTVVDGKLTSGASGGGLEIGDIGFTQMAIDETKGKRRILNGQLIIQDQYIQFTNIIKNSVALNPDLACTEEEWQTAVTMSTSGICHKFVIDDEAGTIRLPKYPDYFIGGVNGVAPVAGNGVALGFTNGTQYFVKFGSGHGGYANAYGQPVGTTVSGSATGTVGAWGVTPDPTKSGIEAQIKQEQIRGIYFIQVATGSETEDNIINEIELINPYVLLEPKYFETEVYNLSWLRANGSFNGSSAIHPSVYNALLIELNADIAVGTTQNNYTKRGLPVKLSTDTYTDYDFVVNTAEETFRLPIKVKLASGKAVVGNGMALGFTNGDGSNVGLGYSSSNGHGFEPVLEAYGASLPVSTNPAQSGDVGYYGITTDPTKSGIELSDSDLYLYFYVGAVADNAPIVNTGRIEEKVASLIPDNSSLISGFAMPSSKYITLEGGAEMTQYTAPANGWFSVSGTTATTKGMVGWSTSVISTFSWESSNSAEGVSAYVPVKRGDTATLRVINATVRVLKFIYAEGEQ